MQMEPNSGRLCGAKRPRCEASGHLPNVLSVSNSGAVCPMWRELPVRTDGATYDDEYPACTSLLSLMMVTPSVSAITSACREREPCQGTVRWARSVAEPGMFKAVGNRLEQAGLSASRGIASHDAHSVKYRSAGPGQPLTRRHGQPFSQESNWLLSCLPARAEVKGTGPLAGPQGSALSPRRAFRLFRNFAGNHGFYLIVCEQEAAVRAAGRPPIIASVADGRRKLHPEYQPV